MQLLLDHVTAPWLSQVFWPAQLQYEGKLLYIRKPMPIHRVLDSRTQAVLMKEYSFLFSDRTDPYSKQEI